MNGINYVDHLPTFILFEVLYYLNVTEIGTLHILSKKMSELASSDHLWRVFYSKRFEDGHACMPSAKMHLK